MLAPRVSLGPPRRCGSPTRRGGVLTLSSTSRLSPSHARGRRLGRGRARAGRHRFSARATRRHEARALLPPRRQAPAFLHLSDTDVRWPCVWGVVRRAARVFRTFITSRSFLFILARMRADVADSCTFEGTSLPSPLHAPRHVRATRLARDSRRCRRRSSRRPAPRRSARGVIASTAKRRLAAARQIVSSFGMRARAIATTPRAMAADAASGTSALDLPVGTGVLFAVGPGAPPAPPRLPDAPRHLPPTCSAPRPVPLPRHPRAPAPRPTPTRSSTRPPPMRKTRRRRRASLGRRRRRPSSPAFGFLAGSDPAWRIPAANPDR